MYRNDKRDGHLHQQMNGVIKTVTIKRDSAGRLWLCFSVLEKLWIPDEASAGEIGGDVLPGFSVSVADLSPQAIS